MIDIVVIMCTEFWATGVEDTEENYVAFIKEFEAIHNIIIEGILERGCWLTKGYVFETSEDEVFFRLKYNR